MIRSLNKLILVNPHTAVILVVVFPDHNHRFIHVLKVNSEEVRQGLQCLSLHQVIGIVILDVHYVVLWKEDVDGLSCQQSARCAFLGLSG